MGTNGKRRARARGSESATGGGQIEDIRVSSWNELQDRLFEHSWKEPLGRFRSDYVFRGAGVATYDLKTSLFRLGGGSARKLEGHLLRNFRKYAERDAAGDDSVWNWLALAQHHGLPTRLLDWTYSPFVAMHFATANLELFGQDGAVWCIDFARTNRLLPERLKVILEREGAGAFTAEMLGEVASSLEAFGRLSEIEFVAFFEPPSLDERIVNQFALFALMSRATSSLDDWLADHPEVFRRIIIPAELKWEVRDKLDQANITERVLLPGLDGLSMYLRRYYTPRERSGRASAVPGADAFGTGAPSC